MAALRGTVSCGLAKQIPIPPTASVEPRHYFPWLLLLFAGSGCAALIYEIVWYQLLQLVIGSSAVSLAVLLATFMGGLCAGSLLLPRLKLAADHPLRVYGKLELGIAVCGLLVLFCMPLVDSVYTSAVGHGLPAILLRAVVCSICLIPPTFLMGASLPAASRWIETSAEGVSWLGLLYGANTVGAVSGCLIAGFYLLRVFDMTTATFAAAAINVAVALASFAIARRAPKLAPPTDAAAAPVIAAGAWPVYVTIAISGATALGGEVIWTRLLGLMLGATVYTFSIILAVFLVGLGIGSTAGSLAARTARNPRALLGWSQLLLAMAVAWTAFQVSQSLPFWPVNPLLSTSPWYTFQIDMVRCAWGLLPATLLWGASFPLALAAAASAQSDPGKLVGGIYAANTAGAIIGALSFSLFLIPAIGTAACEKVLIGAAALGALLVWGQALRPQKLVAAGVATVALAVLLVFSVEPVPGMLIAYGRRMMTSLNRSRILYTGEGINSSIAISEWDDGAVQFHVSGKVEASTESYDMRLQRMLGHMPALMHKDPKSVLIVGFGAGVTAGSFVVYPGMQRIVICEMEPIIPPTATKYFGQQNYNVIHDPRTQIIYDDARHFVLTTPEKFDIITSDPIHPWVKGSATLYSKEYFELVKQHLNPGGVITQWVPLYESDPETVKSEIKTFFDVFPNGTLWGNDISGGGYDIVLLGQVDAAKIDVDAMQARLDAPQGARIAQSLRDVNFGDVVQLLSTYAGQEPDLRPWLEGADINRDSSLRLQYVAGWALNVSKEGAIYSQMLQYRRYPANLLVGSEARLRALRAALESH